MAQIEFEKHILRLCFNFFPADKFQEIFGITGTQMVNFIQLYHTGFCDAQILDEMIPKNSIFVQIMFKFFWVMFLWLFVCD